ncbi:MAG: cytochrome c4 [Rhodoferax sp.]|nr:cytochrome c4 [Rhodoferax sp.]MBK9236468.1 cytochrome c4 [Rhodoferax sp.]
MKQKRWSRTLGAGMLIAGAWMMSTGALAASPNAAMLANACAGCHGTSGGSAGPAMPSLAGQSKEAIVTAMKKFKSGERPSTIMGRLAKGYSDADFAAMGEFFAKQKLHASKQTLDPARVARGAALQEANCSRCHLEDGKEGKDDTPAMASQWLPYMQMQMALYLSNQRKMPEKMAEKVKPLSVDDLEALLQFYASVK